MRFARARRTALLSWLPFAAGCSLLFDFTVEQCKFDVDCSTSGETQLRCEQGLCVSRADCKRNSDCKGDTADQAQICVASKCQSLRGNGCFTHFPNTPTIRDGAIVLGAFSPVRAQNQVVMPLLNYELAVSELNSADGLNGRQVVLVVCDNGYDSDKEERTVESGFKHLAKTLRVPAIVAGLRSPEAVKHVFLLQAPEEAPFLLVPFAGDGTVIEDRGLIWYLLNPSDHAPALLALAQRVEEGLRRQGLATSANVVAWKGTGQTASALWESLEGPFADVYPMLRSVDAGPRGALDELVAARPDIVLAVDGESFVEQLGELEARWPDQRPIYLLSPQNAASAPLLEFLEDQPAVDATRFVGVHARHLGDPQVLERYAQRFAEHFPSFSGIINSWNYYDAVYYLAYAAFAGTPRGALALSSADVQSGFAQLSAGEDVEIGPENIPSAVAALSKDGGEIKLVGALGPAVFQNWSGTPTEAGAAVFCLTREADKVAYRYDALVYNAETGELEPGQRKTCSDLLTPTKSR